MLSIDTDILIGEILFYQSYQVLGEKRKFYFKRKFLIFVLLFQHLCDPRNAISFPKKREKIAFPQSKNLESKLSYPESNYVGSNYAEYKMII